MDATRPRPLAFSYLRFSTLEQNRGDSFRRQTDLAQRYAREHDLALDTRSFADLGVSAFRGANLEVGKLGEFLEAVRTGAIPRGSYLLMESLDRMSRADPWDAVNVLRQIIRAGITVVTVANGRVYGSTDGSGQWELLEAVIYLTLAHQESAQKSSRLKGAWLRKREAAAAKPMTARCPGWLALSEDRSGFNLLEDRVAIVQRIYEEFLDGKGTHAIAEGLNREGETPFGRAKFWHRSYVVKILENPATTGLFVPHTLESDTGKKVRKPQDPLHDYYPAVIDKETFARVQTMRAAKGTPTHAVGRRTVSHLLAGLAECPHCRGAMVRVNKGSGPKGGRPYLVCSRAKAGAGCEYHGVRVDTVEPAVIRAAPHLAYAMPDGSTQWKDMEARLKDQRQRLEAKIATFLAYLEEGPSGAVRAELTKAEVQLEEVRRNEEYLEGVKAGQNTFARAARVNDMLRLLGAPTIDYAPANAALRQLFRKVVIQWDMRAMDFHWQHGGMNRVTVSDGSW